MLKRLAMVVLLLSIAMLIPWKPSLAQSESDLYTAIPFAPMPPNAVVRPCPFNAEFDFFGGQTVIRSDGTSKEFWFKYGTGLNFNALILAVAWKNQKYEFSDLRASHPRSSAKYC